LFDVGSDGCSFHRAGSVGANLFARAPLTPIDRSPAPRGNAAPDGATTQSVRAIIVRTTQAL
jgi:hypothetical protein